MIDERIILKTTEQGYPIFGRTPELQLLLLVSEDPNTGVTDIEISGDAASLHRLGEVLIGISKSKGYHVHMESHCDSSALDIAPSGIRLTVSNSEKGEISLKPKALPPDWARG